MKIVLVNYRYFFAGGPERYLFNIKELLEAEGHEVIPFSVKHKKNESTPYEKYFLSPIGSGEEVYFSDVKKKSSLGDKWKGLTRMIYSYEAKRCFKQLLKDTKPDLVYILYYQNKISCSVVNAAYELGIPVIQRISDYSLLCPCNIYYRYDKNEICELCTQRSKWCSVQNRCVYNSSVYSFIKSFSIKVQDLMGMKDKINRFVFPSSYTMSKFIENGYDKEKTVHIPTLFNDKTLRTDLKIEYNPYALFIGRTDPDKGLKTLLDAFIGTDFNLKIIGFSSQEGYYEELQKYIKGKKHHIEFLGKMKFDQMQEFLSQCLFTIVPSEWYDNLPNTILESYAMRKCVVATDVGSLTENIEDHRTGLLFNYKSSEDLRNKVTYLFNNTEKAIEYGINARNLIDTKYSISTHVKALTGLFNKVVNCERNH